MRRAVTAAAACGLLALAACGSAPHKPADTVGGCMFALDTMQAAGGLEYVPAAQIRSGGTSADIRMLDTAQRACDSLTAAQFARALGPGILPRLAAEVRADIGAK